MVIRKNTGHEFAPIRQVGFVFALLAACFLVNLPLLADSAVVIGNPSIGWGGQYLVGRWTPVIVPVEIRETTTTGLVLTGIDPDGNRVSFLSPEVTLSPGHHQLEGFIKVGCLDGQVGIRIGPQSELIGIPGRANWLNRPLKPSTQLIVVVGEPRGFNFEADSTPLGKPTKVVTTKASDLPSNALAYDSISSLVLAGGTELSLAQSTAIRDWVLKGGRLFISLRHDPAVARSSLSDWMPVKIGDQSVVVREFGGLESYSGKNIRIPHSSTLSIPSLQIESGEVLAASRSDSFLVRVPFGMGSVVILALDLTAAPLKDWKALSPFCARLGGVGPNADGSEKSVNRGSQLSSTGITDLVTQLNAIQENFDRVHRASPWFAMGLLLALLVVVGPVDYFLVHRLLKRPHLTWVTFPLLAVMTAVFASSLANASNGSSRLMNQLDIVNFDFTTSTVRGRHFVTIYSPTTSQSTVAIKPSPLVPESKVETTSRAIWQGVPETGFGGMLREKGFDQGARYEQQSNGELSNVPVMQWSSKALVSESSQSAERLIDCNLKASPTGSLSGTILHRFSSPIEDWMLVYQNRVYRYLKVRDDLRTLPLQPKIVWRVDQPDVFQRELRPFLTGILTMATPRFGQQASVDIIHRQNTYESISLDPSEWIRVLTFHDEIGAERYTGLTNYDLYREDLSHLLKLGRAILVGRLDQSMATVHQDGQTLEPDRKASFVRLILPVVRSGELMKSLPRLVPE